MTTLAYGAPTTSEPEGTPTQPPTISPQDLQKLSKNTSYASIKSWQSAAILLRHIEDVILGGQVVPPSRSCFQEERDPLIYEHPPPPNTDFHAFLVQDYNSVLKYKDYFIKVSNVYSKQLSPTTTRSPEEEPITRSEAYYTIELGDFISSLNSLLEQMEKLLHALNGTATEVPPSTTTLPSECYEICYGQQVSMLEYYLLLAYTYIPNDISGQLDSEKNNWKTMIF